MFTFPFTLPPMWSRKVLTTSVITTSAIIVGAAASVCYLVYRRSKRSPWPKEKQSCAYKQKVTTIKKKIQYENNYLDDFTPVGEKEAIHDAPAFFASHGNEFSVYSIDWEQESVVLIRPVEGTDLKKHPFFREAQRRQAVEVLLIPFDQLQAVVDGISDKVANVEEVFIFNTGRCGSTLLTQAVESTSIAQAASEIDVFGAITLKIIQQRRSRHTHEATLTDTQAVSLLRNVVSLLNYHLVAADPRHRRVIFYKLRFEALFIAELMFRAFPAAKTLFLYRDGLQVFESWTRLWMKYKIYYKFVVIAIRLGLLRFAPWIPDYMTIFGDDPRYSTVRMPRTPLFYIVTLWVGAMQVAVDLRQKHPDYFFHAVIYYADLVKRKEEMIGLLMKKLGIEGNEDDQEEERKKMKAVFKKDSQAGTFLSSRTTKPGESWTPQSSSSWINESERKYILDVFAETGNEMLFPDFLMPDTIMLE